MPHFVSRNCSLYYEVHGSGRPVVLLHGITVSFAGNFGALGWIEHLNARGLQVIGLDFRGHGQSEGSRDPADYGTVKLAEDVMTLLDHLGLHKVSLIGYSLGSIVALNLLHTHPDRFERSVLIATGDGLIGRPPFTSTEVMPKLVNALRHSEYPADLPRHIATYWLFATKVSGDRGTAAAAASAHYPSCSASDAARVTVPVLVISGEKDQVLGTGAHLAQSMPHGRYLEIRGCDHFMLAESDEAKTAVGSFLSC